MPYLGTQPSRGLVGTAGIDADAVTNAKIADDQIDSEHYVNGSIDTAHIAANAIDGTLTKDALIADYSDVTITASDLIMYGDATDSNNTKRDTVQGILDLAGGGSLNFVSAITINGGGGTAEFTSMDEYESYFIRFERMVGSATSESRVQLSQAGGSYITASSYIYAGQAYSQSGTPSYVSRGADHIPLTAADGGSKFMSGWMYVYLKGKSATGTMIHAQTFGEEQATGFETGRVISGMLDTGTIMDGIKIYRNSGDFSSGQLYLYGLSNS